jgi:plastocyanin
MATWMINIVGKSGDPAHFEPQLQPPRPNGEASVSKGDLVNWFNDTGTAHQIEAAGDSTFATIIYQSNKMQPNDSSRPSFTAPNQATTIYYRCTLHHEEHSTIVVS